MPNGSSTPDPYTLLATILGINPPQYGSAGWSGGPPPAPASYGPSGYYTPPGGPSAIPEVPPPAVPAPYDPNAPLGTTGGDWMVSRSTPPYYPPGGPGTIGEAGTPVYYPPGGPDAIAEVPPAAAPRPYDPNAPIETRPGGDTAPYTGRRPFSPAVDPRTFPPSYPPSARARAIAGREPLGGAYLGGGAPPPSGGFGPYAAVPRVDGMSDDEARQLGLAAYFESGFRNIPNFRWDPGHTAEGYYQITGTNWRRLAPSLGITARRAMDATFADQTRVALALLRSERGIRNWSDFNPRLREALESGMNVRTPVIPTETARADRTAAPRGGPSSDAGSAAMRDFLSSMPSTGPGSINPETGAPYGPTTGMPMDPDAIDVTGYGPAAPSPKAASLANRGAAGMVGAPVTAAGTVTPGGDTAAATAATPPTVPSPDRWTAVAGGGGAGGSSLSAPAPGATSAGASAMPPWWPGAGGGGTTAGGPGAGGAAAAGTPGAWGVPGPYGYSLSDMERFFQDFNKPRKIDTGHPILDAISNTLANPLLQAALKGYLGYLSTPQWWSASGKLGKAGEEALGGFDEAAGVGGGGTRGEKGEALGPGGMSMKDQLEMFKDISTMPGEEAKAEESRATAKKTTADTPFPDAAGATEIMSYADTPNILPAQKRQIQALANDVARGGMLARDAEDKIREGFSTFPTAAKTTADLPGPQPELSKEYAEKAADTSLPQPLRDAYRGLIPLADSGKYTAPELNDQEGKALDNALKAAKSPGDIKAALMQPARIQSEMDRNTAEVKETALRDRIPHTLTDPNNVSNSLVMWSNPGEDWAMPAWMAAAGFVEGKPNEVEANRLKQVELLIKSYTPTTTGGVTSQRLPNGWTVQVPTNKGGLSGALAYLPGFAPTANILTGPAGGGFLNVPVDVATNLMNAGANHKKYDNDKLGIHVDFSKDTGGTDSGTRLSDADAAKLGVPKGFRRLDDGSVIGPDGKRYVSK